MFRFLKKVFDQFAQIRSLFWASQHPMAVADIVTKMLLICLIVLQRAQRFWLWIKLYLFFGHRAIAGVAV